ncbi:type II toxin-antitoxin system VapC family toxin [Chondromyces apiculatus]|uniref:PIN domain-containing protein n=1 Tax=Chondromyces apiculatus DSM 436 TaxID=1192034 RepID=A0A017SYV8_9BACT|nr:type II toxin-antitoxin system VapC family toxin [Chondromyces apiculatus]EYF02164.1 Hypothetical protein CAP_7375 [Chondromyces apiculatus DSM 436]
MRILFDTNVVSYWMGDQAPFRAPLRWTLSSFKVEPTFYISAVSLQELMVFARAHGDVEATLGFVGERFNVLAFDEPCAIRAAALAARVGAPTKKGARRERRALVNAWQRDAAIAGTAARHGMDVLVTANGKHFTQFLPYLTCEVRVLDPAPPR